MEIEEKNSQEKYYYNVVYVFTSNRTKYIGTSIMTLDTSFFDREEAYKKIKRIYEDVNLLCIISWHKSSKEEFDHFNSDRNKEIKVSDMSLIFL